MYILLTCNFAYAIFTNVIFTAHPSQRVHNTSNNDKKLMIQRRHTVVLPVGSLSSRLS